jgi:hypothetical protein
VRPEGLSHLKIPILGQKSTIGHGYVLSILEWEESYQSCMYVPSSMGYSQVFTSRIRSILKDSLSQWSRLTGTEKSTISPKPALNVVKRSWPYSVCRKWWGVQGHGRDRSCQYNPEPCEHLEATVRVRYGSQVNSTLLHTCLVGKRTLKLSCWCAYGPDHVTPLYPQKLALNFVDKWRSLSRYSSLVD